jgi:glyoxylase-like metal-dependent hydrolase (beta-lactamase superfamily II)
MQHHAASRSPLPWTARSVRVGAWRVTALSDGFLRLDGGSMWGVVPAPLWRPMTPPAEDNSILLALRPFLLERVEGGAGERVILEPGVGDRWDPKLRALYGLERAATLTETLGAVGLAPEDITHVVASHCHWDHVGAQVIVEQGRLVPRFPRARHFAPAIEVEMAKHPGHVRRASYRAEDVLPIEAAGLLETYSGTAELLPQLFAHELGGHSDGASVITLESRGETAVFWGDVVPTTHHVQPSYIMAYDIDVVRSFEARSEWLARAAAGDWLGLFYHDVDFPFARLRGAGRRYAVEVVPGEARAG